MNLLNKKQNKLKKAISIGNSTLQSGITGGGTGALVGLLAKHDNPLFQKKAALIGTGVGAALGAGKAIINKIRNKQN